LFIDPETKLITAPLNKDHNRKSFSCGVKELDDYLYTQASQDQKRNVSQCFIGTEDDKKSIVGYYTLSSSSIFVGDLSEEEKKKLPKYPLVGGVLIGRLAIDSKHKNKGYGKLFLIDAFKRCVYLSEGLGVYTVVVDAKDESLISFYQKFGFIPLCTNPLKLHLPIKTIKAALGKGINQSLR